METERSEKEEKTENLQTSVMLRPPTTVREGGTGILSQPLFGDSSSEPASPAPSPSYLTFPDPLSGRRLQG